MVARRRKHRSDSTTSTGSAVSVGGDGYYYDSGDRLNILDGNSTTLATNTRRRNDGNDNGEGGGDDDDVSLDNDINDNDYNTTRSMTEGPPLSSPTSSHKSPRSSHSTPAKELPSISGSYYAGGGGRAPNSPHSINKVHHFYSNIYNNNNNKYKNNEPVSSYIDNEPLFYSMETFSLYSYLRYEILGVDTLKVANKIGTDGGVDKDRECEDERYFERTNAALNNIKNFFRVPFKIETFIGLGVLLCLDNYLCVLTYLPIRTAYGALLLLACMANSACGLLFGSEGRGRSPSSSAAGSSPKKEKRREKRRQRSAGPLLALLAHGSSLFHWEYAVDFVKSLMVASGFLALQLLNMSRVYHFIRGQSMIKLYVLTSMIEICDRLLSSFGHDAWDSLYLQIKFFAEIKTKKTRASSSTNVIDVFSIALALAICIGYVVLHSALYFLFIATLTVAMNSSDQALIIVIVLNNFAEIKSFVFKKIDQQNLFQLACSEVTERFTVFLANFCILSVALAQESSNMHEVLPYHVKVMSIMVVGEALADWIKHAFINRFNNISATVYDDFCKVLRRDVLYKYAYYESASKSASLSGDSDCTHTITKRLGLAQLPLVCVSLRYLRLAYISVPSQTYLHSLSGAQYVLIIALLYTLLVLIKVILGFFLVIYAVCYHNHDTKKSVEKKLLQRGGSSGHGSNSIKSIHNLGGRSQEVREGGEPSASSSSNAFLQELAQIDRFTVWRGKVVG